MPQLFSPAADHWLRWLMITVPLALALLLTLGLYRLNAASGGDKVEQPIPFSHVQHVEEVGLDCAYCHAPAYRTAHGGIPGTETCLQCHDTLFRGTRALQPLHEAARTGEPLKWKAVTALPDVARFHHGAHVQAGVSCEHCHGPVGTMEQVTRHAPMTMDWCVDCHRSAQDRQSTSVIRPVFKWRRDLTDCSVCHY